MKVKTRKLLAGIFVLASLSCAQTETTCTDANHPHMIDLGLPSGTKWACCNVGANAPEQYGNYYAWGETQPKEVYDDLTYAHGHDNNGNGYVTSNEMVNIGSDIDRNPNYDAATANWGAPWCIPPREKIEELLNNTTSTWTTQNGVRGRKFTGPNGGTIFLPAAGHRSGSRLFDAVSNGYYWSSRLAQGYSGGAYDLVFDSCDVHRGGGERWAGLSVRPVR